jgi:hypothetical protein
MIVTRKTAAILDVWRMEHLLFVLSRECNAWDGKASDEFLKLE